METALALAEALGVSSIVAGLLISVTGWLAIDPLLSLAIAALIAWSAWRVVSAAIDILLGNKRKFDTAINNMSQGLCLFDAEQRVVFANRRYAEMYGLSLEQVKPVEFPEAGALWLSGRIRDLPSQPSGASFGW